MRNTIYQAAGRIFSVLLGVFVMGIIARYLGKEGFGGFATVLAFLQFFGIVIDFGFMIVTVQMISEQEEDAEKITQNLFTIRFFSALILLGIAPLVVFFFPYPSAVKIGVAVASISFFFISLNQVLIGLFQQKMQTAKIALSEIFGRIGLFVAVLVAVYFDGGLISILAAVVFGSGLNFFSNYLFSFSLFRLRFIFDWSVWRVIIKKSWPLALGILFNLVYLKGDTVILSLYASQSDVGIYGAPYRILEILISFPLMFIALVLPTLTSAWVQKRKEKFSIVMQRSFDLLSLVTLPMVVGTWFIAKPIIVLAAGREFFASGDVLKVIIIAVGCIFIGSLFGHAVVAINRQRSVLWVYAAGAIVSLFLYFTLIPKYSYMGAAWATVVIEGLVNLVLIFEVWRMSGFLPSLKVFLKSAFAAGVMGGVLYFLKDQSLLVLLFASVIVYGAVLFLVRGIRLEDVRGLLKGASNQ